MQATLFLATNSGLVIARQCGTDVLAAGSALDGQIVTSVAANAGVVLAGTKQGIFRSVDGGHSWQAASAGPAISYVRWVAVDPDRPEYAFAGTEPAALFVSDDNASTWHARDDVTALRKQFGWYLPYSPEAGCIRAFAFSGERVYAAAEVGGLLRSDDGGERWALVAGSDGIPRFGTPAAGFIHPDVHSVVVHPSSDLVYCATGGGLYRSVDGGQTWALRYECYCRDVWVDPADPEHIIFGPADDVSQNGRIEESRDGGQNWRMASDGLVLPWPDVMLQRILQVGHTLLAVLSDGRLFVAEASALRWRQVLADIPGVHAVAPVAA